MQSHLSQCKTILLILFILHGIAAPLFAEEEEKTQISSDRLEHQKDSGAYFLKGNVEIRKGDIVLKAKESYFDEKTSDAVFEGGVTYEDNAMLITSDSAEINIDSKSGRLHNGSVFIKKDNYHISAEEIEKMGDNHYILSKVRFTTCDAPLPAWCFSTSKLDVLIGDRLKARNVVLEIKGVPVLYTPYLWSPVLTERKTGLLFPEFGYQSDLGAFYKQPLFIVLSDNRDATVRLDLFSKRGIGEGIEYRYVERRDMSGKWWGYHVRDSKLEKDFYLVHASHEQRVISGVSHYLKLNLLNEDEFYREYDTDVESRIQRFLESSGTVYYSSRLFRYYVSGQYWQDLEFDDDEISQKLPTVGISLHPIRFGPFLFAVNTEATNFYSSDSYQVQRYSLTPSIYSSLGNAVRLSQALKYNGAVYKITDTDEYPSNTEMSMAEYDIGVSTSLFRRYETFTHVIEPTLGYHYMTVSDFDAPLLDSQETVEDLSDVILSLDNNLVNEKGMFFSFRLSQAYNLNEDDRPWKRLDSDLSLSFSPYSFQFEAFYDHYQKGIRIFNGSAGVSFAGIRVTAGQRYDKDNAIQFYTGGLGFNVTQRLAFDSSIWYDSERKEDRVRNFKSSVRYMAQCWSLTVTYNKKPDDYSISAYFTLKGLGDFGVGSI